MSSSPISNHAHRHVTAVFCFGLGEHAEKVQYEVSWTNGKKQTGETAVDRMIRVDME